MNVKLQHMPEGRLCAYPGTNCIHSVEHVSHNGNQNET